MLAKTDNTPRHLSKDVVPSFAHLIQHDITPMHANDPDATIVFDDFVIGDHALEDQRKHAKPGTLTFDLGPDTEDTYYYTEVFPEKREIRRSNLSKMVGRVFIWGTAIPYIGLAAYGAYGASGPPEQAKEVERVVIGSLPASLVAWATTIVATSIFAYAGGLGRERRQEVDKEQNRTYSSKILAPKSADPRQAVWISEENLAS